MFSIMKFEKFIFTKTIFHHYLIFALFVLEILISVLQFLFIWCREPCQVENLNCSSSNAIVARTNRFFNYETNMSDRERASVEKKEEKTCECAASRENERGEEIICVHVCSKDRRIWKNKKRETCHSTSTTINWTFLHVISTLFWSYCNF